MHHPSLRLTAMVLVNKTIVKTHAITASVFYDILDSNNNKEKVLVVASTSQLIVYSGSMTDGISEIGRVDVNGRVIGIDKIRFQVCR